MAIYSKNKATKKKASKKKAAKKTRSKVKQKKKAVSKPRAKAKTKPRRKSGRVRSRGSVWGRRVVRILIAAAVLFALVLGAYSLYLGKTVRIAFDGKRWAVPARVYARPLELYLGAKLSPEQLMHELKVLGYRKVSKVHRGAQWARQQQQFIVRTRAFHFWDGAQAAQHLAIALQNGSVAELKDLKTGHDLDLTRLEPAVIGSIYPSHKEDRVLVQRSQIPEHLVQALLAVEDKRFYQHHGVDPRGIARALWTNIRAGRTVQGGSTLTQQLVKNFVLTSERSLSRKINEALMALIVDSRYEKDEILEAYANEIFLGQDRERAIHGFGLAAYFYFNRPLSELALHETALLVGLVKGASYYNPRRHPKRAKKRRDLVIEQMHSQGYIDAATARRAQLKSLGVSQRGKLQGHRYPAFIQLVRRQLLRDYHEEDLTSEGLSIFTTLDAWDQHQANKAMVAQLAAIEKTRKIKANSLQAAMVMASPQGGEVRALLGGRNAASSGFNRALDAIRPIGSLVKPAIYLTALAQSKRYTLTTLLDDTAVDIKLPNGDHWRPQNYDRKQHGRITLHSALSRSMNLAAVNLGMDLGVNSVVETLHDLGAEGEIPAYPSILLGAVSLSPFQVTQLYQTIAAGGFRAPLRAIREVMDAQQQPLQRYPLAVKQTLDPVANFLLTSNLQEVVEEGTGRGLKRWFSPEMKIAGKTGTTNDLRDSWFAGFSGDRVAVVWVGRDDNKSTGLTGSSGALPIFARSLSQLDTSPLILTPPQGVDYHWVEADTGLLSAEGCEGALPYPYARGSEPELRSSCAESPGLGSFLQGIFD